MQIGLGKLVVAWLCVAAGATIQGSMGFGLNVVAAPLLALIDTHFVPGPALLSAFMLTVLVGYRDRRSIDAKGFGWVFLGRVPATIAAAFLVGALPERGIGIALASCVLAAVVFSLVGWHPRRTPRMLTSAGALSGFMGTVSSVGGPPIAMLYQDASGPEVRGTLSAIFSIGALFSVALLAVAGRFGGKELRVSLSLLPAVVVGFVVSKWTGDLLDRRGMRPAVLGLSAVSAIAAIARYAI